MAGKPKKKRTFGDVLSMILMLAALCVFVYSAYTLYGFYMEYKKGSDEYNALNEEYIEPETEDYDALENEPQSVEKREKREVIWNNVSRSVPTMKNPIDFASLKKENDDLVGWLKLRALDLSYPILQGEDNEFYLHRTFEKEYNFAGCIFLNCDNKPDFTDQNSIIYGHNMKNGSMFGKMKQLQEKETFEKSKYFWIYTPDLIYQYRIFAMTVVGKTGLTYQTMYSPEKLDELLDYAFKNSELDGGDIDVTMDDHIVTLSTCTGDDSTRRVVFGKLVQIYVSK